MVMFASLTEQALARSIIGAFELAGWRINLTNVPLESGRHEYITGTEVVGYNKALVDAVAELLGRAGLVGVKPDVQRHEIKLDNPKYRSVQHYIKLTLGHQG